jgi:hypothetical protein
MSGMLDTAGTGIPSTLVTARAAASATHSSDSTPTGSTTSSGSGNSALARDVQLFMQALYEALSTGAPTPTPGSTPASAAHQPSIYNPPAGLTYSRGSVANYRATAYQQGPKSLQSKLQAMIHALSDPEEEAAAQQAVGGLQGAFNRLLRDLAASGASIESNDAPGSGSGLTLRGWLLGLQWNLQQPGASTFSAVGNMVDVTA